ncbi:Putative AC9 transposase [Linum grandiflorum]
MSDIPPLVQGPQAPVAAVIGNANDAGNGVVAAAPAENGQPQNGEAAVPQPPNAPLAIDEEVIDRAKLKSLVWKHFKKIKVNNVWKAKCNYCGKLLGGDSSNGTSHLKNHASNCLHRKIHEGSQKILGPKYLAKGKKDLFASAENLFVPSICELRIQIYQWMMDSNEFIQRMAASMWTKFIKYWQVIQDLLAIAVVLDPRYKLDIIEYYTERIAMDGSLLNANTIRGILGDLLVEYQVKMNVNNAPTICNHMAGSSSTSDQGFDLFVSQRKRYMTSSVTAELDNYLNEDILPRQPDFDILMWWKVNGPKYPILQNVAKDILALLVTSVASESAFSSGGRVLDPHRSRLHESTVEALMCTRSWLQSNGKYCHNFTSTVLVQLILLYCSYFSS